MPGLGIAGEPYIPQSQKELRAIRAAQTAQGRVDAANTQLLYASNQRAKRVCVLWDMGMLVPEIAQAIDVNRGIIYTILHKHRPPVDESE